MDVLSSRTIITTDDLALSRTFYEENLGLSVYREYGSGGIVTGVVYFLGGGYLELTEAEAATTPQRGRVKLWLQVADLDAESLRLQRAGVTVKKPAGRMPWGLEEMWIEDMNGVELRLVEVPADHPLRRRVD